MQWAPHPCSASTRFRGSLRRGRHREAATMIIASISISTNERDFSDTDAMKTTIRAIQIVFALLYIVWSAKTQAVLPPPDGGYPNFNTAEGDKALFSLTTGVANTAVGWFSLFTNTDGSFNTGVGAGTLLFNVGTQSTHEGVENTAIGTAALLFNTTGSLNTAVGSAALLNNNGLFNTAIGSRALSGNTAGSGNTAIGTEALVRNTTGEVNTAIGTETLVLNSTGSNNTGIGGGALSFNETGFLNTAIGYQALGMNTGGAANTALGSRAGINLTIGDDNICIANDGVAGDAGVIRIGRNFITATYIAGISGQTASGGAAVFVNSDGKLGTSTSSARFKDEIKPMGKASEALFALKPVTFCYKKEIDSRGIPQFGLVAEDVEAVNPDLVVRDKDGKVNTVRYEQVNAMLLNKFLKEHRRVEELKSAMAQQRKETEALVARLNEQEVRIQKVSVQVRMHKPDSEMLVTNQ